MYVVHISSVHNAEDPRIRHKQLATIVQNGWRAAFVTGDTSARGDKSLTVVSVGPGNGSRWLRMLVTAPRAIFVAMRMNADIYHLHDPELLPWAWFLIAKRRPVVYDIHEDYCTSIKQKKYLPRGTRWLLGWAIGAIERAASAPFSRVIAEKYYAERFPGATTVLNYPVGKPGASSIAFSAESTDVLYTGNVSRDRGALQMARLAAASSDIKVTTVGFVSQSVADAMHERCANPLRLELVGVERYVPYDEIEARYRSKAWLAAIALFPDTEHYRKKELTKFFEYMAAGIPIVASNFSAWRDLIVGNNVGICVNADDPHEVLQAFEWLRRNPTEGRRMAENGRSLARNQFTWQREGETLMRLYSAIGKS